MAEENLYKDTGIKYSVIQDIIRLAQKNDVEK